MTPTNDPATAALLERLLRRDPEAWNGLVEAYSGLLMAITRRAFLRYGFTPADADVEDVVADVWRNLLTDDLRVVRQCSRQGYFAQTLHVLARNRTIDMLRRRKMETVPLEGHEPVAAEPVAIQPPLAAIDLPADRLNQALAALTPKERSLVGLFFLQEKKYKEIATLTGVPINSIGPTLGRALAKLKQLLTA